MVTKKCHLCSKLFKAKRWNQKYCFYECIIEGMRLSAVEKRKKNSKPYELRQCTFCQEEYKPISFTQKFCCETCREKNVIRLANEEWQNKKEQKPKKRRDSDAEAYKFFAIKTWYPKNMVFRG